MKNEVVGGIVGNGVGMGKSVRKFAEICVEVSKLCSREFPAYLIKSRNP